MENEGSRGGSPFGLGTYVLRILAVAAVYWTAGRLALLMAIPPGYATAVWPAAGFALVGVLVWGWRVAPGVLIGSFLVNVGTSFDASSTAAIVKSIAVATAIGGGAAAQAVVGAALIRRFVASPTAPRDEGDIGKFMVLGAPVAGLVNATVGVVTLCSAGIVPWSNAPFSWWTWWVGDAIGTLIFAPLALLFVSSPRESWRRRVFVGAPLLVGFVAVTLVFLRTSSWEESRLRGDFVRRAAPLAHALETRLGSYQDIVASIASLVESTATVSRSEFRAFVARALARYDGIQGLGWNPIVRDEDRAAFQEATRRDGLPGFRFTELGPDGALREAGQRPEYVPAFFLEPREHNEIALGYDVASDPIRLDALRRSRASREPSVTTRIRLVQEVGEDVGFLLVVPVLGQEEAAGAADRERAVRGFAVGVFRLEDVVGTAFLGLDTSGLEVSLRDGSAPLDEQLLYATRSASAGERARSDRFQWAQTFGFGGRDWRLDVRPTDAYLADQRGWQAWMVLAGGLLFVGLIGVVISVTTSRTLRAEQVAEERERLLGQLHALNAELEERVRDRTSELSATLREREVLLQEIHHRVKNNLQIISSMINMQARRLEPGSGQDALDECQTRVQAIALIHEKLYQFKDYSRVPFAEYTRSLAADIFLVAGVSSDTVSLELAIDDVSLAVDKAIPCGLILNELITNALKHAFPDERPGKVRVELGYTAPQRLTLSVEDDGVGLPDDVDVRATASVGMRLVSTLTQQLDANLEVVRQPGTSYRITIPMEA